MNTEKLEYALAELLYHRFDDIEYIREDLQDKTGTEVLLYICEDRFKEQDFLLSGEFNEEVPFDIWYLKDNYNNFYITEVNLT